MADPVQGVPAPPPMNPLQAQWCHKLHSNQQHHKFHSNQQCSRFHSNSSSASSTAIVHLNWSHFKPEFSGTPDEDAEAQLLHTIDWMNAHNFVEGVKVHGFCFKTIREARLWYHSLEPVNVNWQGLQNLFRQQYSKIGNTGEQLFHVWRSFSFDENTETIDAYVTHISQVAALYAMGNHKS